MTTHVHPLFRDLLDSMCPGVRREAQAERRPCHAPREQPRRRNGDESVYDHDAPGFCICGVRMDLHAAPRGEVKAEGQP